MKEIDILEVPSCDKCGSKQIRTTKDYQICIRCGHKENIE